MKKVFILTLLLLGIITFATAQRFISKLDWKNDLQQQNLKGRVKSTQIYSYEAIKNGKDIVKGKKSNNMVNDPFVSYNMFGNMVLECNGGNIDVCSSETTYEYNALNKKIRISYYGGKQIMELHYNDTGHIAGRTVYKGENDTIKSYFVINIKGNVLEEIFYKNDGTGGKQTFKYDKNDYLSELNRFLDDKHTKITYLNDKNGLVLEKTLYHNGVKEDKITYKYDKNGNVIEETSNQAKYKYQYKYDENGNWTERIWLTNGNPYEFDERIIEYY